MKVHIIVILLSTILLTQSFGQATEDTSCISKNTVYFELLGNGGFYSFNYDRILYTKKLFKVSVRAGISLLPPPLYYNDLFFYPLEANFLYGRKHHLEIGAGFTPIFNLYNEDLFKIYDINSYYFLRMGYRYQKPKGGIFYKTGILYSSMDSSFYPWFLGLGIGYTFKNK